MSSLDDWVSGKFRLVFPKNWSNLRVPALQFVQLDEDLCTYIGPTPAKRFRDTCRHLPGHVAACTCLATALPVPSLLRQFTGFVVSQALQCMGPIFPTGHLTA